MGTPGSTHRPGWRGTCCSVPCSTPGRPRGGADGGGRGGAALRGDHDRRVAGPASAHQGRGRGDDTGHTAPPVGDRTGDAGGRPPARPRRRSRRSPCSAGWPMPRPVHGIDADQVHFHEVGALDSIADVVGVCAALHDLQVDAVSAGPVALGARRSVPPSGFCPSRCRRSQAGRGLAGECRGQGELTTPTGMALLVAGRSVAGPAAALVHCVGVGAGHPRPGRAGQRHPRRARRRGGPIGGPTKARPCCSRPTWTTSTLGCGPEDPAAAAPERRGRCMAGADPGQEGPPGTCAGRAVPAGRADTLRAEMLAAHQHVGVRETTYRKYALRGAGSTSRSTTSWWR